MDESNTCKEKSSFWDDTIQGFAKNLFEQQEVLKGRKEQEIPLDGVINTQFLKPHQEWYEHKNYSYEEMVNMCEQDILAYKARKDKDSTIDADLTAELKGDYQPDLKYNETNKKEWMANDGCSLLDNMDELWQQIGEVFPEYQVTNIDRLTSLISSKLPNLCIIWSKRENLKVNGAETKISYKDVAGAFDGLKKLVSIKTADKILANIIVRKIKKLF